MSLTRVFTGVTGLGQVIIKRIGDVGGPPASRVSSELDNIIAWAKDSPRRVGFNFSTVGNVGTGLDTLHTFTLPANSLATNNDELECRFGGCYANNTNATRSVFSVDGTKILHSSQQPMTTIGR